MLKAKPLDHAIDLPNPLTYENIEVWAAHFEGSDGRTLRKGARQIIQEYKKCLPMSISNANQILTQIDRLVKAKIKESRMIAGFALEKGIVRYRWDDNIIQWIYRLADDAEWDVREGAQLVLRAAMDYHFDSVIDLLQKWVHDPSPNIRRAALMACRPKPHSRPESVHQMWKIVKPLMSDNAKYVKRNIPYVLGFWEYHPGLLLSLMLSLAQTSEDSITRKNIIRVLRKRELVDFDPKKVVSILDILRNDKHLAIQRPAQQLIEQYSGIFKK